jgi:hypothetical protein
MLYSFYRHLGIAQKKEYNIILHVFFFMSVKLGVSYQCDEQRLRVLENRMLKKMFRPKRVVEVTGEWRKLCNEQFHNWH